MTDEMLFRPRRALLSLSDKDGASEFARALASFGVEILASGGTSRFLAAEGIETLDVAERSGFSDMLGGRVKTLHPSVHAALLASPDDSEHERELESRGISPIDMVAVSLYPFESARLESESDAGRLVELIDIGGCAMLRSAAKNFRRTAALCDPSDYGWVIEEMSASGGGLSLSSRERLAGRAFARCAAYDSAVSSWLLERSGESLPSARAFGGLRAAALRYGENPHESAALYLGSPRAGAAHARLAQGRTPSYNNYRDADAAFSCVCSLPTSRPSATAVKHGSPCGAAFGASASEACERALGADSESVFGGVAAINRPLDVACAEALTSIFLEVVIAPDADEGALRILSRKPSLRVLLTGELARPDVGETRATSIAGGVLARTGGGRVARSDVVADDDAPRSEGGSCG